MSKVLIIEDEKNIRETIKEILELNDYEIAIAENGLIGIAKALQFKPDLIVCDVMMPEMDGFDTLKNIRAINEISNTPFVFLTAKTETRDFREGMNSGADDFLNKPFNTQELLEVIQLRISKSNQAKELFVQEINNLKEEVENLQNSINKLSFNNSHILRAPLLKILGLINYIIEDSEEKSQMDLNALSMLKASCLELSEATEEVEKLLNTI
ncbi:MAG: response regulator transcription factor [Flavobacteriales bacterium]|tara:strand:+ start:524 stop:1159 length:636 start_codon:yes stop_codon:yes gene_type:complete